MNLVEIQISLEEDYEILTILENQKTNLLEILKKKAEKESNFKSFKFAEKEAVSKLQSQVLKLEKSVNEKFNIILQSIENNQTTVKIYAQIASQNIQAQILTQDQELSQNGQKTKVFIKPETQAKILAE